MWNKCVCGNEGIFYQTLFKLKHIQVRLLSRDFNLRWIQICSWLNDDSCSSGVKDSNQFKPVKCKKFHVGLFLIIIFQILVLWPLCVSLCSCQTHRQTQRRLRLNLELLLPAKRVKTKWWRIKRTENKTTGSLYLYFIQSCINLAFDTLTFNCLTQTISKEFVGKCNQFKIAVLFFLMKIDAYIFIIVQLFFVNEKYEKYLKMWNLKWIPLSYSAVMLLSHFHSSELWHELTESHSVWH